MGKSKTLELWQSQYIDLNHANYTIHELAIHLSVPVMRIKVYCQDHDLKPKAIQKKEPVYRKRDSFHVRTSYKKKKTNDGPDKVKMVRAPAVYSNRSREEIVAHYLKLKL